MTRNITEVTRSYESPLCDIVVFTSEGVLCASLEQLQEDDSNFVW